MPETTVAAIIVAEKGKKILLTRRNVGPFKGQWCLPGGHVDKGESTKAAIIREVAEEVGLNFTAHFFGYFDETIPDMKISAVVTVFDGPGKGKIKAQPDEVTETKWFSLEEARSLSLAFTHNEILDVYAIRQSDQETKAGLLEEYKVLREEINQRMQARDQLLTFTLVTAGTLIGLAVQFSGMEPAVLLAFPILVTFLATAWTHHDIRISQLGNYIRQNIEPVFEGMGWHEHLAAIYGKRENRFLRRLTELSAGGTFVVSALLTVVFALTRTGFVFSTMYDLLLLLDIAGIAFTLYLVQVRRGRFRKMKPSRLPRRKDKKVSPQ